MFYQIVQLMKLNVIHIVISSGFDIKVLIINALV